MNPHFIFNCISAIQNFVFTGDVEASNRYISGFAQLIRQTLDNSDKPVVALSEEIKYLQNYLSLEQMRFSGKFSFTVETDPAIHPDYIYLPPMLLQPLVENAIKYAVSPQEAGAEITIATQLVGQNLRITVSDTGPGLQSASASNRLSGVTFDGGEQVSTGVGLANIRDRLAQAYGEAHRFETMEPAEGGFAVLIEIPFERREAQPALEAGKLPALAG